MDDQVRHTVEDGVATVVLHHPAKLNAMTARMWLALPPLLDRLAADPAVRALVLTGAGGTFCAGADIASLRDTPRDTPRDAPGETPAVPAVPVTPAVPQVPATSGLTRAAGGHGEQKGAQRGADGARVTDGARTAAVAPAGHGAYAGGGAHAGTGVQAPRARAEADVPAGRARAAGGAADGALDGTAGTTAGGMVGATVDGAADGAAGATAGAHEVAGVGMVPEAGEVPDGPQRFAVAAEQALADFPGPTLAAVRGYCVGGGCQLAAACDLRFADEKALFGVSPARLGIVYPPSSTRRLVDLVGPATTKYLLFSAELIDAPRALRTGLVDEVLPAGGLDARVAEFTRVLTSRSHLTQVAAKEFTAGRTDRAGYFTAEARRSGETAEGVAAFLERRAPHFRWPTQR